MNKLNEKILIHGFLDNTLTSEQIDQFNLVYRTNPEFALSVNSYLNIMSALKAADKMRERVAQKKRTVKIFSIKPYYKHIAVAASLMLIISIFYSLYTAYQLKQLQIENKILATVGTIETSSAEASEKHTGASLDKKIIKPRPAEISKISISNVSALASIIRNLQNGASQPITRSNNKFIHVFPENSKLAYPAGAKIVIKNTGNLQNCSFTLNNLTDGDTIIKVALTNSFETILLENLRLKRGEKYYWVISKDKVELEVGTFSYISKNESEKLNKIKYENSADFVNAFIYYYENGFLFDAYAVLERAVKKYPSEEVFLYLASLMNKN
jgi:hypothetical protein